jgi:membrane protease YdiL (CAAX protease family)
VSRRDVLQSHRGPSVMWPGVFAAPDEPTFRPGIALAAWFAAFVFSTIGAQLLLVAFGYSGTDSDTWPIWLVAILQVPLWVGLTGAVVIVSRHWGTGSLRRDYGLRFLPIDVIGVPIGVLVQLVFVPVLYRLLPFIDRDEVGESAESLTDRATGWGVLLLILLVVVGAPIVEELFFRGLVMRSIQARYSDWLALVGSALLFALVHFNPLTFPALAMFGLVLGYLAQRTRRLGMSVFAHAGFNATTVALLLLR